MSEMCPVIDNMHSVISFPIAQHKNGTIFPIALQVELLKVGPVELFRGTLERVDTMEAVFTIDDDGTISSCNHNFVLPLFGYTTTELIGKNISILIPKLAETCQPGKQHAKLVILQENLQVLKQFLLGYDSVVP